MDISKITPEIAEEVNHKLFIILNEIDKYNQENGIINRTFRDRLYELDLWDSTSIAEEYARIKDKESTLPRYLRDTVVNLFELALSYVIEKHSKQNNLSI